MPDKKPLDARFWAGFALFVVMFFMYVLVKEFPVYFFGVPGLLMGFELPWLTDKFKK